MKMHQGVWLPDVETHLVDWMDTAGELVNGVGTYQIKKLRIAVSYAQKFRTAVDIGAHCGLWSMQLIKQFRTVYAFEPVAENCACLERNMANLGPPSHEFIQYACALGDHEDMIKMTTMSISSAASYVDGAGNIPMHTLDSFELQDIDFIKIDTEGYEPFVVKGAEHTIKRCKPVIIVEQKGHGTERYHFRKNDAADMLKWWGMVEAQNLTGDVVLVWP